MPTSRRLVLRWPSSPESPLLRFLGLSTLASVLAIVLSITLAFRYVIQDVDFQVSLQENPSQQISLIANFLSVDAKAGTMTVDWYPLHSNCSLPEIVADIFFDENLLAPKDGDDEDEVPSSAPPEKATFQFNTTTRCSPSVRNSFATFRTTSKLISRLTSGTSLSSSSLQAYPFDRYAAQISMFAQVNSSGEAVGINFEKPFGAPVNFNIRLGTARNAADGLFLTLEITRAGSVQLLAMIIVLANWIITLAFLFITAACLVWPEDSIVSELIALPIGALFAFTTVRANLPGAPDGFGAFIDFVGILPNIAIITLCGAVILVAVLVRRIRNELGNKGDGPTKAGASTALVQTSPANK